LGLKKFLEWIAAKLSGVASLVVPPLITAASILAILFAAHTLAGTPEIAATIAFPFSVSTLYAILYNWGLWRRRA
jgi:mannose/fructose/N-acetylgalactosamine-specific phosphotransferase system component IIC